MRKTVLLFLLCAAANGYSALITYDPINHGTAITNEIVNFAKWAKTEVDEAATTLNTLNTYEETVLQVVRMGDPKTLVANLPGVQNAQTLSQIYSAAMQDANDWAAYVNPQSWKMTADSILNIYGQEGFDGFTAANGIHLGAAQSLFQFQVSNYNTLASAQQRVTALTQQLQTETQQLATATSGLQAATTTSAVQKYQGSITALHASIDATKAALQAAEFSLKLQTEQNNAAQQISQAAQAQKTVAEDLMAIDAGLNGLPTAQMNQPILWGSQP